MQDSIDKQSSVRGDGFIYLRGPIYWIGHYVNGKLHRESAKTADRDEALKHLRKCVKNAARAEGAGVAYLTSKGRKRTIGELVEALRKDFELRGKASPPTLSNLRRIDRDFGMQRATAMTRSHIDDYIAQRLADGDRPATVNRALQLLSQAFKFTEVSGPRIRKLSEVGNERQGFLEVEQVETVVAHLPEYLRDFVKCDHLIGWRKASLQSLRWPDVIDDVIYLRAVNSKTRKPETVPIEGELRDIIDRRRAAAVWQSQDGLARFSEFVFHDQGRPIGDFRKAWATACVAAGVGKFVCRTCDADVDENRKCSKCGQTWRREDLKYVGAIFHDFRRTAARNLIRAGVPVPVAMKITGHRTDSMFRRYAIVSEDQKREALAKTQAYLAAATERKVIPMRAAK